MRRSNQLMIALVVLACFVAAVQAGHKSSSKKSKSSSKSSSESSGPEYNTWYRKGGSWVYEYDPSEIEVSMSSIRRLVDGKGELIPKEERDTTPDSLVIVNVDGIEHNKYPMFFWDLPAYEASGKDPAFSIITRDIGGTQINDVHDGSHTGQLTANTQGRPWSEKPHPDPITFGDWMKGRCTMFKLVVHDDDTMEVMSSYEDKMPYGLYTVWAVSRKTKPSLFGPFGGIGNVMVTDGYGDGVFHRKLPFLLPFDDDTLMHGMTYHNNANIYGGIASDGVYGDSDVNTFLVNVGKPMMELGLIR